VDVALRVGEVDGGSLVATRVGDVGLVTCASPSYLARAGVPRHPSELEERDCIVMADSTMSTWASWRFQQGQERLLVEPRSRMKVGFIGPAVDAAVAGLGLVQTLTYQVKDQLADGTLVPVLEQFAPPPLPTRIIYPTRDRMAVKSRAFIDFIVPRIRAQLGRDAAATSAPAGIVPAALALSGMKTAAYRTAA
jgi:DNA-binding transcriptional LysR family regulator